MSLLVLPSPSPIRSRTNLLILFLVAVSTAATYLLHGTKGYDFWDEGFLWYGAQRVLAGEVPIRDFMAYDPGRYYWSAAILKLLGTDGLPALRAAGALFQAIGVFIGLRYLTAEAPKSQPAFLALAAVTLTAWMFPWFKVFDTVSSIALVAALTLMIRQPSPRNFFALGIVVGFAAVLGKNHGVYGLAGSLGAMVFLAIRRDRSFDFARSIACWAIGVAVGFLPIALMGLLIPGFAAAFLQSIVFLFELKATNLAVPVPWPWVIEVDANLPPVDAAAAIAQSWFFVAILAFGILGLFYSFIQRARNKPVSPGLVAASLLALPYAQYSLSRADLVHLAQGVFPALLGCFGLLAHRHVSVRLFAGAVLCGASVLTLLPADAAWRCYQLQDCVKSNVGGSVMTVTPGTAREIAMIHALGDAAGPNENILVTPYSPGAYALLHRRSPIWENYALFARGRAFEQAEIDRIRAAAPLFVLINNAALDDREEQRFRNTHPLTYQYVLDHYDRGSGFPDAPWNEFFTRKAITP